MGQGTDHIIVTLGRQGFIGGLEAQISLRRLLIIKVFIHYKFWKHLR